MAQVSQTRTIRGYAIIAKGDEPRRISEGVYEIRSQSGLGSYRLTKHNTGWSCTCPDYVNRHETVGDCKHVSALRLWLRAKEETERTDIFALPKTVLTFNHCRFCNSIDLLRWGYRKTRQGKKPRFKCRNCGKRFVADEGFLKSHYDPKVVTLALDLYFKGASLRKVTQHIAQFYGVKVSHVTLIKWIRKFSELIDNYANTLKPQLSGVWNCDEMKTKMAHEEPINGERFYWLWNALDNGSRYLVASHLTRGRGRKDAQAFFEVAKKQAKKDPQVLFSDGLDSYRGAYDPISLANYGKIAHIANVGIRSHMGNHRVERLHNSMREREKVMRHLKKANSAEKVFKGYRAYYNFVRPHMALENHTPAEMAAIPIQLGTNRWLDLIRQAARHRN
ncbi:MAG: DDE-type integrase/transposase/recombinase [Candidatus Bathyarchaeia archaeon]